MKEIRRHFQTFDTDIVISLRDGSIEDGNISLDIALV